MGDVADEAALGRIQFHLAGEVLDGDGDALEGFTAGITHRLQNDAQGAGRFPHAAAQVFTVCRATEQGIEGTVQFDGQQFRQFPHQLLAFQAAPFPAEQTPRCGIGQHDAAVGIQQHGAIGHGGDQRLLLHLGGGELLDVGLVVGLELGGHGVEAGEQFPQFPAHWQVNPGTEVAGGDGAHPPQQLLHRAGDGEGVEHRAQDHQHPDRDEHRHGHLPGEGCAGQGGLIRVHPEAENAVVLTPPDQGDEHIGDGTLGREVLPHQGVLGASTQLLGQLQSSVETKLSIATAGGSADRDPQVDDAFGVGEEDVADAAAGTPELFGHVGQLTVLALRHQLSDIAGQQQAQIPGVARVVHHGIALNSVQREEGDARHHQAHHQGGNRQQLGLEGEFRPPGGDAVPEVLVVPRRLAIGGKRPISDCCSAAAAHPPERT